MSNLLLRNHLIRPKHLCVPLLRRLANVTAHGDDRQVHGTAAEAVCFPEQGAGASEPVNDVLASGPRAEESQSAARARKAVSIGRLLLVVTLLLTSAMAMKLLASIRRSREFHPNWVAKNPKGLPLSGD